MTYYVRVMGEFPKTLVEFDSWFPSEEACRQYLFDRRWPKGFCCPRCQHTEAWLTKRGLYLCSACNYQVSVTAGTIFHGSRKPLQSWFRAIWHITSQDFGANALELQRILDFGSYHTAWEWLHKLRRTIGNLEKGRLHGWLELDMVYIGDQQSGKKARSDSEKTLIVIVAERKEGFDEKRVARFRLGRINDLSVNSLTAFIKKNISAGSTVCTNSWPGYNLLQYEGYRHNIVSTSDVIGEDLLPLTNSVASSLKKWLRRTYQGAIGLSYLDYYLDEYTFKYSHRRYVEHGFLFYILIKQAVVVDPSYKKDIR
ncbi:IS1595 family transposase [Thermodesulfobacteriota bacterium]